MPILLTKENERCTMERVFPVSIAETDCTHCVKPVVILNYMQDLAYYSIEKYDKKFGCNGLAQMGLAWFIIRYHIEFENNPIDVKQLKVLTESRGVKRLNAYRDFEVYDNLTGNKILSAASSWFIVDTESKSVINAQKIFPDLNLYQEREGDLELAKLKSPERIDYEKTFHVRYDDIDVNNHVNNTVYITWALEALDYDFRKSNKIKSLDIYFKHDVSYGEDVISQAKYNPEDNTTEHVIKKLSNNEELCILKIGFVQI